jgi:hypothetical protein
VASHRRGAASAPVRQQRAGPRRKAPEVGGREPIFLSDCVAQSGRRDLNASMARKHLGRASSRESGR